MAQPTCRRCGAEIKESNPDGMKCPRGHWTPRDAQTNLALAPYPMPATSRSDLSSNAIETSTLILPANITRLTPDQTSATLLPVSAPFRRPLTDLGNAERIEDLCGNDMRYSRALGGWLVWNGRYWGVDQTGEAMMRAKQMVRAIYREAAEAPTKEDRLALAAHARRSEAGARIEAALRLAESALSISVGEFDLDPWLLNVANGTIDLRTGKLRPHRREDYITRLIDTPYRFDATAPRWEQFLQEVLPDGDVRRFIHKAAGYSATGSARERAMILALGVGRNGKGILIQTLREALGEYAVRTPSEMLLARKGGSIPNDVAQLRGARFAFASETEDGRHLDEAKIKDLTGGEEIPARFMRAEWFSFKPNFTLWLATNHRPIIKGQDDGIWDRLRLVQFPVRFRQPDEPDDGRPVADLTLSDKLAAEREGILAWIVRGAVMWSREGLGTAEKIRTAVAAYRDQMDVLGSFLSDRCVQEGKASVGSTVLYQAYKAWAEASGETALSQKVLSTQIEERGFKKRKTNTGKVFHGLRLRNQDEPWQGTLGDGSVTSDGSKPDFALTPREESPRVDIVKYPSHPSPVTDEPVSTPWPMPDLGARGAGETLDESGIEPSAPGLGPGEGADLLQGNQSSEEPVPVHDDADPGPDHPAVDLYRVPASPSEGGSHTESQWSQPASSSRPGREADLPHLALGPPRSAPRADWRCTCGSYYRTPQHPAPGERWRCDGCGLRSGTAAAS